MKVIHTFQERGTYRLRFQYSRQPNDWTLFLFNHKNIFKYEVKRMPVCDFTEIDFLINHDHVTVVMCHPNLVGFSIISASNNISVTGIFACLIRKLTKNPLELGHCLKIKKANPYIYILAINGWHKDWQTKSQLDFIESIVINGIPCQSVPDRYHKELRLCLFCIFPSKESIHRIRGYRRMVSRVIVVLTQSQYDESSVALDIDHCHVMVTGANTTRASALAEAISKGLFDDFDFVGLILDDVRNCATTSRASERDQRLLYEVVNNRFRDLFFGKQQDINYILALFERYPFIDILASPMSKYAPSSPWSKLNLLCKSDIGENIWLRCSSLKRSPYQHVSIEQCIFQKSKAITEKGDRIQYHVKSGFRIFIPDFGDLRDGESAGLAKFRHLRSFEDPAGKKVVLFVCFAPNGLMRKHSFHYMRQLRDAGFIVYALAANDRADLEVFDPGQETCDALVSRENVGFDFAIWAATILKNPRILQASDLLLVNDSVIGPLFSMDRILTDIELSSADIVGLTDSSQIKYHIQSFFLYIKRPVIKSDAFLNFIIGIKSYIDKETVIQEYELNFISLMIAAGFRCEALFSLSRLRFSPKQNPSIECWRELLAAGFPFLKSELVRDNPCHDDLSDIESIVRSHGDDQYIINSFEYVPYWPPQARQV